MPWWGKSKDSASEQQETTKSQTFDPSKLPAPEQLPKKLQKLVDAADEDGSFFDGIAEG